MIFKNLKETLYQSKKSALKAAALVLIGGAVLQGNVMTVQAASARQVESLNRGLVAVKTDKGVYLSWRLLGTEDYNISFNIYRNGNKIAGPIKDSTNYLDAKGSASDKYYVRTVVNGVEMTESDRVSVWGNSYLDVPIEKPGSNYSANDASVADVDGDGAYEIILKWDPDDSKDNSQSGKTSNVYVDCYELDGTKRWRIDLGKNIRAGAHYTQFIAYDLNGDGKAEVGMKTADGTVAGDGTVIGDASKDYRNSSGYILSGPEYYTLFEGATGKALTTIDYEPARGTVSSWGDKYGNRVDRFLAGVAYLDGRTPSLIVCRGYYTRTVIVAYKYRNGKLNKEWTFDTNASGNSAYAGQGNHNLSIADVDGDGYDEIVYGSAVIDQNGKGLYSTGMGHGDALHVGDFDPTHSGLEIYQVHEDKSSKIESVQMRDAKTGKTLWADKAKKDVGRGVIANIGPDYYPYVAMASTGHYDKNGNKLNLNMGKFGLNFVVWWDGDLYREGLDKTYINKYNYTKKSIDRLLTGSDVHSNNTTKATPSLSGDILGDWREEVIWAKSDDTALRIYTTTSVTEKKLYTFMHDVQYREAIAWQNVGYNQPPHPSFYVGEDMATPSKPNVYTAGKYKEKQVATATPQPTATPKPTAMPQPTQAPVAGTVYEFETANHFENKNGNRIENNQFPGYSGSGYVYLASGWADVTFTVPEDGEYKITICSNSDQYKENWMYLDDTTVGTLYTNANNWGKAVSTHTLKAGTHKFGVSTSWGYVALDYIKVEKVGQSSSPSGSAQALVVEEGTYMIQNEKSGLYLEVKDGLAQNAANVQQWGAYGARLHNTWRLSYVGNGYYKIYSNVGDGSFLLDLDYGRQADGTNIQIYSDTASDAQLFKFVKNQDGTYTIKTKSTNDKSCLMVADSSKNSGANIYQWTCSGESSQKWKLVKVN